jgi:hypothetical protein
LSGQPGLSGAITTPRTFLPSCRHTSPGRITVPGSAASRVQPVRLRASSGTKQPSALHMPLVSVRIATLKSAALGST